MGIHNRVGAAAACDVQTAGAMTGFAADVLGVVTGCLEPGVGGSGKVAGDFLVTGGALIGADKFRAGNAGRRQNRAGGRATRKENDG